MRGAAVAALVCLGLAQGVCAETIRIGVAFPGGAPDLSRQLTDGFELGMRHSGQRLGGRDVQLAVLPPAETGDAKRIEEFVKAEKPQVLLLASPEKGNIGLLKSLSDAGVIVIIPGLGGADLAGKRCQANVFVTGGQTNQALDTVAAYADAALSKRLVLVHTASYAASAELLRRGIKSDVLREVALPDDLPDYEADVARLLADKPLGIVLQASTIATGRLLKALRATPEGRDIPVIWPGGAREGEVKLLGAEAAGLLTPGGWATGLDLPANSEFVTGFVQSFGHLPTSAAVYAYDAARLIDVALVKLTDPYTPAQLRDGLHEAALDSPRGVFSFSNNNFPIQDFWMRRVELASDGAVRTVPVAKVFARFGDDFAAECPLR
jgi:branched-chain amino acid transport system substrate-binding protein